MLVDANPKGRLNLLQELTLRQNGRGLFQPCDSHDPGGSPGKGPEQGHPLLPNDQEKAACLRSALRWGNGRGRAQRFNSAGVTVVAAPRGSVHAGVTIVVAPKGSIHARVAVVAAPRGRRTSRTWPPEYHLDDGSNVPADIGPL